MTELSLSAPVTQYWLANKDFLLTFISQATHGVRGFVKDGTTGVGQSRAGLRAKGRTSCMS